MVKSIHLRLDDKQHRELAKSKAEVCLAFGEKSCSWERFFLAGSRYTIQQLKGGRLGTKRV